MSSGTFVMMGERNHKLEGVAQHGDRGGSLKGEIEISNGT